MPSSTIRTEVRGLDLSLDGSVLSLSAGGKEVVVPVVLPPEDAALLRVEMAKALLPEWNQIEEARTRATTRYRRYLGSWLMMCVSAFTAYVSYPQYLLCLLLSAFSIFLWWRAGFMDQKAERQSQALRNAFRPDWFYIQQRLLESDEGSLEDRTKTN